MLNPFALTDKKILITGASSGLGRAMALICSKMGATVFITGRNAAALAETYNMLEGVVEHKMIVADLSVSADIDNLIGQLPALDGVVNNAGINKRMLAQYIKEDDFESIVSVNLKSPIMIVKALLKSKKINAQGSCVFISSVAAHHSSIGNAVYSATKGGISSYAKVLALELAPKKIRVNTVQPGMVRTGINNGGPLTDEEYKKDAAQYPLGRYGLPEEVAYAVVYLLSDASMWITGTDLVIDGGFSLI